MKKNFYELSERVKFDKTSDLEYIFEKQNKKNVYVYKTINLLFFELLWSLYPNKKEKEKAKEIWISNYANKPKKINYIFNRLYYYFENAPEYLKQLSFFAWLDMQLIWEENNDFDFFEKLKKFENFIN